MTCLKFLREEFVENKFRENLNKLKMVETEEERDALETLYGNACPPEFHRETAADILALIQNGGVKSGFLVNDIEFASQGDCEYAWVIDLDNRTFEAYEGWNRTPLTTFDRFYFLGNYKDGEFCSVKCTHKWLLKELPTEKEFIQAFEEEDEEEGEEEE